MLKEFNYCARDIAYVAATVDEMGNVSFADTQYVSPCNLLSQ
ncbi:MAG: hypothetical protein OXU20_23720 [Myxococcales bacterium]|nr:hypothetical protein [Myxococcales bacterium]